MMGWGQQYLHEKEGRGRAHHGRGSERQRRIRALCVELRKFVDFDNFLKIRNKEEHMEEEIGKITHYFSKIGVGVLEITKGSVRVGDTIHIKGHTTDYYQKVQSMQVEHTSVELAEKGMEVGLKVESSVREGDTVFKVTEE
jgi:translation initiation factor IF-2